MFHEIFLIFTTTATCRGHEQFGNDSEELPMIHDKPGDFPQTGCFANGVLHHGKLYFQYRTQVCIHGGSDLNSSPDSHRDPGETAV